MSKADKMCGGLNRGEGLDREEWEPSESEREEVVCIPVCAVLV